MCQKQWSLLSLTSSNYGRTATGTHRQKGRLHYKESGNLRQEIRQTNHDGEEDKGERGSPMTPEEV